MTATRTLYRQATVSPAEATASLFKRFPTMDLVSFVKKAATAEEAAAAKANEGDVVYAATIRVAEFPPAEEETSSGEDTGGEDAGAPAPKESDSESDSDDDSSEQDDAPDFAGKEEGGEHKGVEPKKLSPEEQMIHLLQQILDSLNKGDDHPLGDGPDGMGGPPGGGLDLPDVGAPEKGDMMGGPGAGGPMGGKAPLPPPVKQKSPIGVGAFAHVASHSEVQMVREDASTVNNKQILAEAAQHAPTHYVSSIKRTGLATIGNDLIDLAEAKLALVTLVSK